MGLIEAGEGDFGAIAEVGDLGGIPRDYPPWDPDGKLWILTSAIKPLLHWLLTG